MLSLKPITKHNWIEAIPLTVREDQEEFMTSNTFTLAQLNFLDDFYKPANEKADISMKKLVLKKSRG